MTSNDSSSPWAELNKPAPRSVTLKGARVGPGSRVRLWPAAGGDLIDMELAGRTAVVEGVDQDLDDNLYLAVILEEDPGQDLGHYRQPGHRFFFRTEEVDPLGDTGSQTFPARILIAGVGDEFKGDSAFGPEVVRRLAGRPLEPGTTVTEFGIRIRDLIRTIDQGWDAVIVVAAVGSGGPAGRLSIAEQAWGPEGTEVEVAGVGTFKLPAPPEHSRPRIWVVGCDPAAEPAGSSGLSEKVAESVERTVEQVGPLVTQISRAARNPGRERSTP